jgi:LysM repeat protein
MRRSMMVAILMCIFLSACAAKTTPTPTPTPEPTATPRPTAAPTATLVPTPTRSPTPTLVPTPTLTIYVVQQGDVLGTIAKQFGTTVEAIAQANGITDANLIRIGQELLIPPAGATPAPVTPTSTP